MIENDTYYIAVCYSNHGAFAARSDIFYYCILSLTLLLFPTFCTKKNLLVTRWYGSDVLLNLFKEMLQWDPIVPVLRRVRTCKQECEQVLRIFICFPGDQSKPPIISNTY